MKFSKPILSLAVLLLSFAPVALAQGTYTQIDYPGAIKTFGSGIDEAGEIVGYAEDAAGNYNGFLYSGGVYTTIDYPGATDTYLFGLNDLGKIVGETAGTVNLGFVYDVSTQSFTQVSYPGAVDTAPFAINNVGTIGGYFNTATAITGFELAGSKYRPMQIPGATYSYAFGVSASGKIVGYGRNQSNSAHNFSFVGGKYKRIVIPNAPSAYVQGINPAGTALVGQYTLAAGVYAGFVYENKTLQTLTFPGGNYTGAYGINSAGEVVGVFQDSNSVAHGFIWTPPAAAEKK